MCIFMLHRDISKLLICLKSVLGPSFCFILLNFTSNEKARLFKRKSSLMDG